MGKERLTPVKAIRKHCIECMGFSPRLVSKCPAEGCALYPYRMGRNPARKGKGGGRPPKKTEKTPTQVKKTE